MSCKYYLICHSRRQGPSCAQRMLYKGPPGVGVRGHWASQPFTSFHKSFLLLFFMTEQDEVKVDRGEGRGLKKKSQG